MLKKLTVILVLLMFIFSAIPAYAAKHDTADVQKPIIYESIITVGENGGVYKVGFATVKFPKGFIDDNQLPITFKVEISAVNGVPGIEFSPDIPAFNKDVTIMVHKYNGLLYDSTSGRNIHVDLKNQKLSAKHFSRFAFS